MEDHQPQHSIDVVNVDSSNGHSEQKTEKAEQRATRPSSVLNTERRGGCASYSLFGQRNELEVEGGTDRRDFPT